MKPNFYLFLLAACFTSASCISTRPVSANTSLNQGTLLGVNPNTIETSLFNAKEQTISEQHIAKILDTTIKIKDSLRIAVFNYSNNSNRYQYYWSDETYLKNQQDYVEALTGHIDGSKNVKQVLLMPSIMANANSSIINLRETAVRLQADFLLVYSIKSDIYLRYKTFSPNETKAFATIEVFLMDTKTGIIPFTTIITRETTRQKSSKEFSDGELREKTKSEAVLMAMDEIGNQIFNFLRTQ